MHQALRVRTAETPINLGLLQSGAGLDLDITPRWAS